MLCKVRGGQSINGEIQIFGAKNEVLKLMVASCVTTGDITLNNIPLIEDVYDKVHMLKSLGITVDYLSERSIIINSKNMIPHCPLRNCRIRTSINFLGLILGRFGEITIPYPHGDKIGTRNLDMHVEALNAMGAEITIENDQIKGYVRDRYLKAIEYTLRFQSMGATENIILAGVFAKGITVINNASIEPEIRHLCEFLRKIGVIIEGVGTCCLKIHGRTEIYNSSISFNVKSDRMQMMSYMLLPLCVPDSKITIKYCGTQSFGDFLSYSLQLGLKVKFIDNTIICTTSKNFKKPENFAINTGVYPLFHTDILPPFVVAMCLNSKKSIAEDYIYNNRFAGYVNPLNEMGAKIHIVNSNHIEINSIKQFNSNQCVSINDIRCGPTVLWAALNNNGTTVIRNLYQLERGYDNIIYNLQAMGADITVEHELYY